MPQSGNPISELFGEDGLFEGTEAVPEPGCSLVAVRQNSVFEKCAAHRDKECDTEGSQEVGRCSVRSTGTDASFDSQLRYGSCEETIILLDWDDTLFPTSWLLEKIPDPFDNLEALQLPEKEKESSNAFAIEFMKLVGIAKALGTVVVVTNATRPWVTISQRTVIPQAEELMSDVAVFYAMELVENREHTVHALTQTKVKAIEHAVTDFYSQYEGQSWKNVISVGDRCFELDAAKQVCRDRPPAMLDRQCRTKTVKFVENPSLLCLAAELALLATWLTKIVQANCDVTIDMSAGGASLKEWAEAYDSCSNRP
jgi:hypothetical protein